MQDHNADTDAPLHPIDWSELNALLVQLLDGKLSPSEQQRLGQILDANQDARRYYLQHIAIHSALSASCGSTTSCSTIDAQLAFERITLDRFAGHFTKAPLCSLANTTVDRARRWRTILPWAGLLAAAILVAVALWWTRIVPTRNGEIATESSGARHPMTETADDDRQPAAEVSYVSSSAVWQDANNSYALGSVVRSGQGLTLERGEMELTYSSGTKLVLTGPSEFVVLASGGILRRGELVARVPKAGHGFTIETPHGKVVDLGTEFGIVVDDFGVSQVSVFEGKVETLPSSSTGATQDKIELTSGRAIQWTEKAVIPIDFLGRRYRRRDEMAPVSPFGQRTAATIEEEFHGEPLDSKRWNSLGEVDPSPNGLRMGNATNAGPRPYLLTAGEFDPSQGAITVICDLRFDTARDAENASFAILTRCSDERSTQGTAWQDMLSRSVSCRLTADPRSGEGLLEVGTKYESDRELANIFWGGFSRPRANTLYRLEMRDDGINVTFTVSLVENPSVCKTITCRSLFRSNHNFIALEGSETGTAVVERLLISQNTSPIDSTDSQTVEATDRSRRTEQAIAESSVRQLSELAPADASLLLQDDFEGRVLDSAMWTTLSDVVLKDGQLQLGLPNDEQHIDTWRARSYLITKEKFDPADGAIVVLGQATFAENFLHGYGGSFAVMSRADNVHGGGPGWENSILRRGVRSNFWPAAFGFDHSLEVHEKPAPDTIRLLAAEGFRISPLSRTYLFCVTDDGDSAVLTLIDAANPAIRKTISHRTTSSSLAAGHVAFESCWGSPVLIDNIRIFRAGHRPGN